VTKGKQLTSPSGVHPESFVKKLLTGGQKLGRIHPKKRGKLPWEDVRNSQL